ncbi:MAG: hypothetical protein ACYC1Q_12880 [Bacteroidia bacterium]
MKSYLASIILLFLNLTTSAQDVAYSEKIKTQFHTPLTISGDNILLLSTEKGELALENWSKSGDGKIQKSELDLSELKESGDVRFGDAFVIKNKLFIVVAVLSREPLQTTMFIGQFDLEGNLTGTWDKLVELERKNRYDVFYSLTHTLSPDKSKYIFAINSKNDEKAKYKTVLYDCQNAQIILETTINTGIFNSNIDESVFSINNQGDYALWIEGELDILYKKSATNKDVHHLFWGNSKSKEVKNYSFEIPTKLVGSTSILMQSNGDIIAMGMTEEDVIKPAGLDGYYRAVLKKGADQVVFQTYGWNPEILQEYYSTQKLEVGQTLPYMKPKGLFMHESGDVTFVTEEFYLSTYDGEESEVTGSIFAVRMDSSGKVINYDLCFKFRDVADLEMKGSFAFLLNDELQIIFKEHSDIWKDGQRDFELSTLKQSQAYYCSLTHASFGSEGFVYEQINIKKEKSMCIHFWSTSFLSQKVLVGIGRQINALYFVSVTLP